MLAGVPWLRLLRRRRDTIGVVSAAVKSGLQAAGVALLPYSSNVITHAQGAEAIRQIDVFERADSTNAGYGRDTGVESTSQRH